MTITVRAFAKINLMLHVVGLRPDGYHDLRTTFQSIALDDSLTFASTKGSLEIACDDPRCPSDHGNIVWKAAVRLWEAAGRSGTPAGVRVRIEKRIPMEAGLGGGSADAAAALRALAALWRLRIDVRELHRIAASLGADVPFLLEGGTAFGVGRGDVLVPLPDVARQWVVLAVPGFGVSTKDAYAWYDDVPRGDRQARREIMVSASSAHSARDVVNDLEEPVIARHPQMGEAIDALCRIGARHAAMSGSGSAVFGLFGTRRAAEYAADAFIRAVSEPHTLVVTRTLSRVEFARESRPVLARK